MFLQTEVVHWLEPVGKSAPVIVVLLLAVWWLLKQLEKKDEKIEAQNVYIQVVLKDSITTLLQVNSTMDKVVTTVQGGDSTLKEVIIKEAEATRAHNQQLIIELKKVQHLTKGRESHLE